jgi:hypothetical protein
MAEYDCRVGESKGVFEGRTHRHVCPSIPPRRRSTTPPTVTAYLQELIFQKRMSIAHSVLLLLTLLFILTTRGVRLDLPRLQPLPLTSPMQTPHPQSPQMRRSASAFLPISRSPASEPSRTPELDGEKFMKVGFRHLSPEREGARSAPSSPGSLGRRWQSPTPSQLQRFLAVSDTDEEEPFATEDMVNGREDYPTPAPSQEEDLYCTTRTL